MTLKSKNDKLDNIVNKYKIHTIAQLKLKLLM